MMTMIVDKTKVVLQFVFCSCGCSVVVVGTMDEIHAVVVQGAGRTLGPVTGI